MQTDPLAAALGRWADGLSPAARDQLSTYDIRALYDRLSRGADDAKLAAFDGWLEELGPATRAALSRYDRDALEGLLGRPPSGAGHAPGRCAACGGRAVVRTGACLTCQDCGATTGCG